MKRKGVRQLATAYHEVGHAVMCWHLGIPVKHATIAPNNDSAGHVRHTPLRIRKGELVASARRIEKHVRVALAGDIAQRIHRRESVRQYHAASDHQWAVDLALHVKGSGEVATAWLDWLHLGTVQTVKFLWPQIAAVAEGLMKEQRLTGEEITRICVGG